MNTDNRACARIDEAVTQFAVKGRLQKLCRYGNGHINDTFLAVYEEPAGGKSRYILQRMNHEVFREPEKLMDNVVRVTGYLREAAAARGGDPNRETLCVVRTTDGASYYRDGERNYWRMYLFVENSLCLEKVTCAEDFRNSGIAFGNFQKILSGFPVEKLHETIADFHNTPVRLHNFRKALREDRLGRAAGIQEEIDFVLSRSEDAGLLTGLAERGELPLRVTHNDTKLNNVLFDQDTGKALCVIDLDTVMPGLAIHDFGDSIRYGANTGAEDEKDLEKVSLDMELYEAFTAGYLEGCGGSLTQKEVEMLPMGARLMTYECGMRFLTDYLEGDVYFKIHRNGHNLDRARTQFKLVADMEAKWDRMAAVTGRAADSCT